MKRVRFLIDVEGVVTGDRRAGECAYFRDGWADYLVGSGKAVHLPLPFAVGDLVVIAEDPKQTPRRIVALAGDLVEVTWDADWPQAQTLTGLFQPDRLRVVRRAAALHCHGSWI